MEKANEKLRAEARRNLNDAVRSLVAYAKKRDLRVDAHKERMEKERALAKVRSMRSYG